MRRFGGQLDPFGVHGRGHPGHLDRLPGRLRRGVGGQVDRGGEPPGAVDHHPHGQADVVGVEQRLQVPVGQADLLTADLLGPEVGVLGPQVGGLLPGRIGQLPQRERGELGIHFVLAMSHGSNLPDTLTTVCRHTVGRHGHGGGTQWGDRSW